MAHGRRTSLPAHDRGPDLTAPRSRPVRVAHLNDIASVGSTLVGGLRALGVDAVLIDPSRPGRSWPRLVRPLAIPLRLIALVATVPKLRRGGFDVVHGHFAWKAAVALLSGRPLVVHCHGSDVRGIAARSPRGIVTATALRRARLVYFATPDLADDVRGYRRDATFLPNPIDTTTFAPRGEGAAQAGDAGGPGFAQRDVLVGVRLDPVKGVDEIEATVRALLETRPSTTITIVGHGSELDRLVAAVRSAARASGPGVGATDPVAVVPPLAHDRVPALLARHRAAIGQFRVGAIGNFELEALASGLPVAASFRFDGAYDIRPPVVDSGDPAATGRRLAEILDDETERLTIGAAGREWVVAHHAVEAVSERLLADYLALLGA